MKNSSSDNVNFPLPDQRNYDQTYGQAFRIAGEKLKGIVDLEDQCRNSGSVCQATGTQITISLTYLNRTYMVTLPEVTVSLPDSQEEVALRDKILILHYLVQAKGTPLTNKLISYKELREGPVYFPSFYKRAIKPLVDHFGRMPEQMIASSELIGGRKVEYGNGGVLIPAFPRVPVTVVLWKGDDEFPSDGNMLFDSTIADYLSTEDINILCQTIAWKMVKINQGI